MFGHLFTHLWVLLSWVKMLGLHPGTLGVRYTVFTPSLNTYLPTFWCSIPGQTCRLCALVVLVLGTQFVAICRKSPGSLGMFGHLFTHLSVLFSWVNMSGLRPGSLGVWTLIYPPFSTLFLGKHVGFAPW